jgi:hypothetical protein
VSSIAVTPSFNPPPSDRADEEIDEAAPASQDPGSTGRRTRSAEAGTRNLGGDADRRPRGLETIASDAGEFKDVQVSRLMRVNEVSICDILGKYACLQVSRLMRVIS